MREEAGHALWPAAVHALAQELGAAEPNAAQRKSSTQPAGLTEREVDILQMLTRGLSRREMAQQLVISEHTVRHHLEHIYAKVGVGTRVAAVLFAVEHDLVR